MKNKTKKILQIGANLLIIFATASYSYLSAPHTLAAARPIIFPVIGPASFSNDFYAPRSSGIHGATDIIAAKGQPLVATRDGTITRVNFPQPDWGYAVYIRDDEGYTYRYLHINDDNPGTNDGRGGPMNAYAPDMLVGNRITRGQLIGYVGDSGNANGVSHLHFEMVEPNGQVINPYDSLVHATRLSTPNIAPQMPNELLPYNLTFKGGVSIAMGNFDGDSLSEMVTGPASNGGPHIRLFDSDNNVLPSPHKEFMAYDPAFYGGIDVAAGDVDGDGIDEIITGAGPGGGPHVRVFKIDGSEVGGFFAYNPSFSGGVRVAAADVDGDNKAEIITGPGAGGGPHVRVFTPNGMEIMGFFAYDPTFRGGVDVAAADLTGSPEAEIITGAGPGGGPHVKIFAANNSLLSSFFAYAPHLMCGVRVSAGNVRTSSSKAEIVTVPAANGGPHIEMFDGNGTLLTGRMFHEQWWSGYYDVAAGSGISRASTGVNRRGSIRAGL